MKILNSTTQQHLDIEDITSDMLILKDGSACIVLSVSAINFGLLSETEQDATIYAYAQLLNSLTFSIQIVVTSKQKDISDYLALLDKRLEEISSPLIKAQLLKYREFIRSIVRQGNVLDKKFYVVIPFSSLELGTSSAFGSLVNLNQKPILARPVPEIVEKAELSLSPKRDHLNRLFARIGLRTKQLTTQELTQLYFNFYNRDQAGTKIPL
jgi:hypothetical protein